MKARFSKLTLVTVALLTLTACSQSQSTSSKSSAKEETKQTQTFQRNVFCKGYVKRDRKRRVVKSW